MKNETPITGANRTCFRFLACFGHTTVYDRFARSLVIFGKKANKMEPTLAVLKLTTNELDVVSNVPQVKCRAYILVRKQIY